MLRDITERSLGDIKREFRDIYNGNYQLMSSMLKSEIPLPEAYKAAIQYVLNDDLEQFFRQPQLDTRMLQHLVDEFQKWGVSITSSSEIELLAGQRLFRVQKDLRPDPSHTEGLTRLVNSIRLLRQLKLPVNLWKSQNLFCERREVMRKSIPIAADNAWQEQIDALADLLEVESF
ncbi:MAG: hypothetical protein R2795_07175 [Saprospiraceae bacterium]